MPRPRLSDEERKRRRAERQRRWRAANLEKSKEQYRRRVDYHAEYQRQWRADNPEHTRRLKRASAQRARRRLRDQMLDAYGRQCACCGENGDIFLTLDHVNRDGAEHRRATGSWQKSIIALRNAGWPRDGYRILCWNCQYATYRGVCPHQATLSINGHDHPAVEAQIEALEIK